MAKRADVVVHRIPLSDVIASVAEALIAAQEAAAARSKAIMRFDECELEFAVEVERQAEAGVNVWALELGGSAKRADSNVVRVKFKSLPGAEVRLQQQARE